jgi:hypothetical protein
VPNLRIVADLSITRTRGETAVTNQAALVATADLAVTTDKGNGVTVSITVEPRDFELAIDPPDAQAAEKCVMDAACEIASALNTRIVLDGLEVLASSHPGDSTEIEVAAYELGYDWVLQVFRPIRLDHGPVPKVFRLGNVFTLVLSEAALDEMAVYAGRTGRLPPLMNDKGMVDPHGMLRVQSVRGQLDPGWLTLDWQTITPENKPLPVRWRISFVSTGNGLALDIREIGVAGKQQSLPSNEGLVNPIDELIRNIAMGHVGKGIFISPLGRLRFTLGEIADNAIMVAGRA